MPAKRGENRFAGYQSKRTSATLEKVRAALRIIKPKHTTFKNLNSLIDHVAGIAKVSRTTISPNRNREAYLLCADLFASRSSPIAEIPDDVADEFVLREKLRAERLLTSNLKAENQKLNDLLTRHSSKDGTRHNQSEDHAFEDTAWILVQLLERFKLDADCEGMYIRDPIPEKGRSDIIAKGVRTKAFLEWLSTHPLYVKDKK